MLKQRRGSQASRSVVSSGKQPCAALHCIACDLPSEFSITLGLLDSMTATQELVVPRSIPMTLK